jgi:hypothetical protein
VGQGGGPAPTSRSDGKATMDARLPELRRSDWSHRASVCAHCAARHFYGPKNPFLRRLFRRGAARVGHSDTRDTRSDEERGARSRQRTPPEPGVTRTAKALRVGAPKSSPSSHSPDPTNYARTSKERGRVLLHAFHARISPFRGIDMPGPIAETAGPLQHPPQ